MSRSTRYLSVLIVLGMMAIPYSTVKAQGHFDTCVSLTGGNASIVIPAASGPTIDGLPLEIGDEIAVFTPEGLCGGSASWTGSNLSITAWVDDSITPATDGFVGGDPIVYKVWDASAEEELSVQEVSYSSEHSFYRTDGMFGQNSIYAVSTLTASAGVPAPIAAHDHVSTQEDTEVEIDVLVNDTYLDSGAITIEIARNPARGIARIQSNSVIYTPDTNFHGQDTLRYQVQNSTGGKSSARIVIAVAPVDDAPYFAEEAAITNPSSGEEVLIGSLSIEGDPNEATHFIVEWNEAIDVDGDQITYTWELSATQDFTEPILSLDAGEERQLKTDHTSISGILQEMGISVGSSYTFYHRILAKSAEQEVMSQAQELRLVRGTMTRTNDGTQPGQFTLDQNYPNPFNPSTTIAYTLGEESFVTLTVYDVVGREVATLVADRQPSGQHSVSFEAGRLNSGVYAYRIEAGSHTEIKRMVLLK